jgi:hypothetical protein
MSDYILPTTLLAYDASAAKWTPHNSSRAELKLYGNPLSLRIALWNVWGDNRHSELRHPFILDTIFSFHPLCSVVLLQEVTGRYSPSF